MRYANPFAVLSNRADAALRAYRRAYRLAMPDEEIVKDYPVPLWKRFS